MEIKRQVRLEISNGPGKWSIMLAVFHGVPAVLTLRTNTNTAREAVGLIERQNWRFQLDSLRFLDAYLGAMRHLCTFTTYFPGGAEIEGVIDCDTRVGWLDVTQLCERGVLPWPMPLKCFACEVDGLATKFIDATDGNDAYNKLEAELAASNDAHGMINSIREVARD